MKKRLPKQGRQAPEPKGEKTQPLTYLQDQTLNSKPEALNTDLPVPRRALAQEAMNRIDFSPEQRKVLEDLARSMKGVRAVGVQYSWLRVLGFRVLRLGVLGLRVLGLRVLGFRVLGFSQGFGV